MTRVATTIRNKLGIVLFCLIGAPGIICFFFAANVWFEEQKFLSEAKRVEGKIIRLEASTSGRTGSRGNFAPVVEYKVDGKTYTVKDDYYQNYSKFSINAPMVVLYNPANPAEAQIDDDFNAGYTWVQTLAALGTGFLVFAFMALGFSYLYKNIWSKNESQSR